MKKHGFFALLVTAYVSGTAQNISPSNSGSENPPKDSISNKTWIRKINQSFGMVATGQSEAVNLVNYGSFEPVNGGFKLNAFGPIGSVDRKFVPFFNLSGGGKISGDNVGVLFNNSKFSSGATIKVKIHIPLKPFIDVSGNAIDTINRKIKLLTDERDSKKAVAMRRLDRDYLFLTHRNDNAELTNSFLLIGRIKDSIRDIQVTIAKSNIPPEKLVSLTKKGLELHQKLEALYEQQNKLQDRIKLNENLLDNDFDRSNQIAQHGFILDTMYKRQREDLENSIKVAGTNFIWLSFVGSIDRRKFYTFNDKLPFATQFDNDKFTIAAFGMEFNYIGYSNQRFNPVAGKLPNTKIVNFGVLRTHAINLDDLSTTELTDSRKYSSSDSAHSLATKYNVYTDSIITYRAWRLYLNYYTLLGKKRNMAFHLFPDVEFRNNKQNPLNVGLGFIVGIKNKKDNVLFNMEFYYKLLDVGKTLPNAEEKFFKRNELGLNFGFPISLK